MSRRIAARVVSALPDEGLRALQEAAAGAEVYLEGAPPAAKIMEGEWTEEELLAEAIRMSQETAAAEAAEVATPDETTAAASAPSPAPLPSPFAQPAHSAAGTVSPHDAPELPPAQQQVVDALVAMSFPLEAARQAVVLSGATDVQHALASLLDEPPMAGPAAAAVAAPPEQMLGQEEDEMTQEELLRMFGLQASIHKMQADGGEDGFWAAWS